MGLRWTRPARECPDWCAKDHRCTAKDGYPSGEHRSRPITIQAPYGVLVCTRIEQLGGRSRMEIRINVDLDPAEETAHRQARHLAVGIDLTVRAVLAGKVPNQPALPRSRRPRPH
jgi:hypothetical protein